MTIIAAVKTVPHVSFRGTRISLPVLHFFFTPYMDLMFMISSTVISKGIDAHILVLMHVYLVWSTTDTENLMIITTYHLFGLSVVAGAFLLCKPRER